MNCICHDPLVFGHLTCRGETQPNNSAPRRYSTGHVDFGTSWSSMSFCTEAIGELDTTVRTSTRQVEQLASMLHYLTERYSDPMHTHANLEEVASCQRCAPRHG